MEPIKDAAWFYSSLAQSSAAIVGLFGAVFITRLVDHLNHVRGASRQMQGSIESVYVSVSTRIEDLKSAEHQHEVADSVQRQEVIQLLECVRTGAVTESSLGEGVRKLRGLSGRQVEDSYARWAVTQVANDYERLLLELRAYNSATGFTSLILAWLGLAWLTVVGVIVPLWYLPTIGGIEEKRMLLGGLGVGIVLLLGFMAVSLVDLGKLRRFSW